MDGSDFSTLPDWPVERTVYLTLDLECDYGTAMVENHYHAATRAPGLVDVLADHGAPLTCFLQTAVIDEVPASVSALRDGAVPVEFHPHSHTHPRRTRADVAFEVERSTALVREHFETDPVGYRFPDGAAETDDYGVLKDQDIAFDASLFPTFRPGRYNNLSRAIPPQKHLESGVIELPFSVYSPRLRIPVSLSYLKVFGQPFEQLVLRRPPSVIVFNLHMHDLVVPPTYDRLDRRYRVMYARRARDGYGILRRFLSRMDALGYRFGTMTELYEATAAAFE